MKEKIQEIIRHTTAIFHLEKLLEYESFSVEENTELNKMIKRAQHRLELAKAAEYQEWKRVNPALCGQAMKTQEKIEQYAIEKINATKYSETAKASVIEKLKEFAFSSYNAGAEICKKGMSVNYVHNSNLGQHESLIDELIDWIKECLEVLGWNDFNKAKKLEGGAR